MPSTYAVARAGDAPAEPGADEDSPAGKSNGEAGGAASAGIASIAPDSCGEASPGAGAPTAAISRPSAARAASASAGRFCDLISPVALGVAQAGDLAVAPRELVRGALVQLDAARAPGGAHRRRRGASYVSIAGRVARMRSSRLSLRAGRR